MSAPPCRSLILALVVGSVVAGSWRPAAGQETDSAAGMEGAEVVEVRFEGNRTFPSDSLAAALAVRPTRCRTFFFIFPFPFCPLGLDFAIDRRYLEPRMIRRDSLRVWIYYYERGYEEARVDTAMTRAADDAVRITFGIDEGRPRRIDSLAFSGVEDVPGRAEVLEDLPVEEGDPYSTILLEASRDTIVSRLRNRGHPNVDVLIQRNRPAGSYTAQVDFDIYPGPRARFGAIVIGRDTARTILSDEALRRMLPFREGDLYSKELVYQAQRNLFNLEIVRNASIEENLTFEPDTLVPLTVRVAEGDEHRVRTGVGWSTSDCLNTEATWASRNFMGGARRLQVRGRVSNLLAPDLHDVACFDSGVDQFAQVNWLAEVELFQPWFFSTRNTLTLSVFAERQSLPDVFVRKAVGVTGSLTRNLGSGMALSFSYRPQLSSLDAAEVFFCTSFLVCTPDDIEVLQAANWLSPLAVTFNRNRTDDLLNPSDGHQIAVDLEHASPLTGSRFAYNRVVLEGTWYQEMARRTVWATRARFGWVGAGEFGGLSLGGLDVVHPQKRFYGGGASSVRGFPQNRLGPRVLTAEVEELLGYREGESDAILPPACEPLEIVGRTCDANALDDDIFFPRPQGGSRLLEATLEYRFRVGQELQAVLFTDVGQVWAEGEALQIGGLEVSPGAGVRYFSPIGPIRVDAGYRFRGAERLQVVTSGLRPFDPEMDDEGARLEPLGPDLEPTPLDWVEIDDLALLEDRVLFGETRSFFRSLQLHFSIGQAF